MTVNHPNVTYERSSSLKYSHKLILYFCIVLSGASSLVYELIWARALNLVFGVSHLAVATVTAVFLLGLASGSYFFGKASERVKNVFTFYAFLEFGIGIFSALSWFALKNFSFFNDLYYLVYNRQNILLLSLFRLFFAAIILLPPTCLIGGTIPAMSRIFLRNEDRLGSDFSKIYYLNTLGGLIGAALTGFFLIKTFGVSNSFYLAVLANAIIGTTLMMLSKSSESLIFSKDEGEEIPAQVRLLFSLFLLGFVSLGIENLLVRIQNIFTSNTTYSFTAILSGYLAGICLGSMIVSRWCRSRKVNIQVFLYLAISMGLVGQLILLSFSHFFVENLWGQLAQGFVGSLIFALLPGILFPLGVALYLAKFSNIGIKTGRVYFFNTFGSVLGSLVTGFVLIPVFGIHNGSFILATLLFLIIFLFPLPLKKSYFFPSSILFLSIFTYFATSKQFVASMPKNAKLVFYEEGLSGTVTVTEKITGRGTQRQMAIDGNAVSSNNPKMIIDAKLLAHLPLLLHPNPNTVATVGYGTGGTSKSMLFHRVKTFALEIEKKIIEGSKLFPDMSEGVIHHHNFKLALDDARSYLQSSKQMFDVIVTDCTNLKYKSNPLLYTTDFFNIMKSRLLPGGISAAWVPLAGLSFSDLKILIASFQKINPNMTIWLYSRSITHFVVFVGTENPLKVNVPTLVKRIRQKGVREDLATIGMTNEYYFASMLLLRENDIKKMVAGVPLHTDEYPILEFSDIDQYLKPSVLNNLDALLNFQSDLNHEAFSEDYQENIRKSMQQVKFQLKRIIKKDRNNKYLRDEKRR